MGPPAVRELAAHRAAPPARLSLSPGALSAVPSHRQPPVAGVSKSGHQGHFGWQRHGERPLREPRRGSSTQMTMIAKSFHRYGTNYLRPQKCFRDRWAGCGYRRSRTVRFMAHVAWERPGRRSRAAQLRGAGNSSFIGPIVNARRGGSTGRASPRRGPCRMVARPSPPRPLDPCAVSCPRQPRVR